MNKKEKEADDLRMENKSLKASLKRFKLELTSLLNFVEEINSPIDAEEILNNARRIIKQIYSESSDIIIENLQLQLAQVSREWENPDLFETNDIVGTIMSGEIIFIENTGDPASYLGEHRSYFVNPDNAGLQKIYKTIVEDGLKDFKSLNLALPDNFDALYLYHLIWKVKNNFKDLGKSPYTKTEALINEVSALNKITESFVETIKKDVTEKMLLFHTNRIQTYLAIPLMNQGRATGFLRIAMPFGMQKVSSIELPFIKTIANLIIVALDRAETFQKGVYYHSVTGLPKKILFLKYLDYYLKNDKAFSILFTDLDNFKQYVEEFGHAMANDAINEYGVFIKSNLPENCIVSNFAGDEFMILVPDKNKNEAAVDADAVRKALESHMFYGEPLATKITVSIGVCDSAELDTTQPISKRRDSIIQYADYAMFYAKSQGRNKVCVWNKSIPEKGKGIKMDAPKDAV